MKRKLKSCSVTFVLCTFAIVSIICNIVWIEYANPLLSLNPILDVLHNNGFMFIIDNELQRQETSSAFFHYTEWAYCIHFVSCLLAGSIIDAVKNKLFIKKISNAY
jgi:hypothetical protein